jgi:CS domain
MLHHPCAWWAIRDTSRTERLTEVASVCRMQYNQNAGSVEVQVFAQKLNTQKERVRVDIGARHLKVEVLDEACQNVEYSIDDDLYEEVDPAQSKFLILSTQVLIKMKKADGAVSWPSLTKSEAPVRPRSILTPCQTVRENSAPRTWLVLMTVPSRTPRCACAAGRAERAASTTCCWPRRARCTDLVDAGA